MLSLNDHDIVLILTVYSSLNIVLILCDLPFRKKVMISPNEQDLRREAIRRRLNGERRKDTCQDLERSTRWFNKW